MRNLFLYLLLTICLPLFAHSQLSDDFLRNEIKRLEADKADTILSISDQYWFPSPQLTTIENVGYVWPEENWLIFYRRGRRVLRENLLIYRDTTHSGQKSVISNPVVIAESDTLFAWIRDKIGTIEKETILPFIYKTRMDDTTCYVGLEVSDEGAITIGLFTGEESHYMQIVPHTLQHYIDDHQPESPENAENLNYFVNTHTQLYQLYSRIQPYLKTLSSTIAYPKK